MRVLRYTVLAAATATFLSGCLGAAAPSTEVGDCLQVSDLGTQVSDLPTVSCTEPHEAEVYAVFDLTYEGDYDENAVISEADAECIERFDVFVDFAYLESEYDYYFLYPLAEGWAGGDREAICAVVSPNWDTGELLMVTGSLEGAGR